MLAELLPFLRNIALGIQNELGPSHPGVLPTTMIAFAMTSILLGLVFLLLAALRCGNLVGYFPETVMTGVVGMSTQIKNLCKKLIFSGAVGVSLCILAFEVTFPATAPHLSLSTLFSNEHIPLLAASAIPAILICISIHVPFFAKRIGNLTLNPMYVPICCFAILVIFWIAAAAIADANIKTLVSLGWLFRTKTSGRRVSSAASWNYWALFNFSRVEWRTLTTVTSDMSLLVLIGTLTLPVFASITVNDLKLFKHNMNHEFVGHGIANLAAGVAGTLPATMVRLSSARWRNKMLKIPRYTLILGSSIVPKAGVSKPVSSHSLDSAPSSFRPTSCLTYQLYWHLLLSYTSDSIFSSMRYGNRAVPWSGVSGSQ